VNVNTPRVDDSVSVWPVITMLLSPLSSLVYALSNSIVGQAARVHASTLAAVSVESLTENEPLHTLQSARVDSRPSLKVIE
jgi:hypothetical protein